MGKTTIWISMGRHSDTLLGVPARPVRNIDSLLTISIFNLQTFRKLLRPTRWKLDGKYHNGEHGLLAIEDGRHLPGNNMWDLLE